MSEKKRVKIDDHDPEIYDLFPFKKYAQVIMDSDGLEGTVVDAEYVGDTSAAPHYNITFLVKSNRDGSLKELKLAEILHLNKNRRRSQ